MQPQGDILYPDMDATETGNMGGMEFCRQKKLIIITLVYEYTQAVTCTYIPQILCGIAGMFSTVSESKETRNNERHSSML